MLNIGDKPFWKGVIWLLFILGFISFFAFSKDFGYDGLKNDALRLNLHEYQL